MLYLLNWYWLFVVMAMETETVGSAVYWNVSKQLANQIGTPFLIAQMFECRGQWLAPTLSRLPIFNGIWFVDNTGDVFCRTHQGTLFTCLMMHIFGICVGFSYSGETLWRLCITIDSCCERSRNTWKINNLKVWMPWNL